MSYLKKFEETPKDQRWALMRGWMQTEPLALYKELRSHRPVLEMPELTLVTRHVDCSQILLDHDSFSVAHYAPKQGTYFMAQDDTAEHWREKSVMKAVLDFEKIPEMRAYIRESCAQKLSEANGSLEAIDGLTRRIPVEIVKNWFGFSSLNQEDMVRWSYWSQMDAFWNQPFDAPFVANHEEIIIKREKASQEMAQALLQFIPQRIGEIKNNTAPDDPVTKLLKLFLSGGLAIPVERVGLNIGGLLIGAVETTSHASANALTQLFADKSRLKIARQAAKDDNMDLVTGCTFEALRFQPAFPYFFRHCEKPAMLSAGTDYATPIAPGTTVLAVTHSAMFDEHSFVQPETFDPSRNLRSMFHFGLGLHECLGRVISTMMVSEIVRAALLVEHLEFQPLDRKGGAVPEEWNWHWTPSIS